MIMKKCSHCKKIKELSEFCKSRNTKNGLNNQCRICNAETDHRYYLKHKKELNTKRNAWYQKNKDRVKKRINNNYHKNPQKADDKASIYAKTDRGKESRKKANARYKAKNPEEEYARNKVSNAIRDGRLKRLPCMICGTTKSDAHHQDYNRFFDVQWLCRIHHKLLHRSDKGDILAVLRVK